MESRSFEWNSVETVHCYNFIYLTFLTDPISRVPNVLASSLLTNTTEKPSGYTSRIKISCFLEGLYGDIVYF